MPRPRAIPIEQEPFVCQMYDSGKTTSEIATHFKCSSRNVALVLRRHSISFRKCTISDEGRRKISKASKKQWAEGKTPPMLGRKHSSDSIELMKIAQSGSLNHRWNGGRRKSKKGNQHYIYVLAPEHPSVQEREKKYVAEHRLVMETHLGRFLERDENVHHINGIKDDNRIKNLEVVAHANHFGEVRCPCCQKTFRIK